MKQKSTYVVWILMFLLLFNVNVFAQEQVDSTIVSNRAGVYTINDVIYSSPSTVPTDISPYAVWVTYDKTVILMNVHELMDPSLSDWPQTIYYTEPNPLGYGDDAWGTLYLKSAERIPGSISAWYLTYEGEMGYFLY